MQDNRYALDQVIAKAIDILSDRGIYIQDCLSKADEELQYGLDEHDWDKAFDLICNSLRNKAAWYRHREEVNLRFEAGIGGIIRHNIEEGSIERGDEEFLRELGLNHKG